VSAHQGLDESQLRKLLAVKKIRGVGDVNALKLFNHFKSAEAIFEASDTQLTQIGLKATSITSIRTMDFSQFDSTFKWLEGKDTSVIPINSTYYPPLLLQTATPPLYLFTLGNYELLLNPQLAVIGSRSPTPMGSANTQQFCKELVNQGLAITSGLAQGIDGEAHRAALSCNGYTIAVSGTGLKTVFPAPHKNLAHEIADKGLIISENFPDQGVIAGCFPRRNRIIAGISLGTLVIEAAERSGSLITAKIAMEESRDVFAIPGSIHNPLARGCHSLIKQGAKLVESVEDILEELPAIAGAQKLATSTETRPALNIESAEFLKNIDYEITSIDTILNRSELSIESVTNKLLLLELDGWIINSAGGYSRL